MKWLKVICWWNVTICRTVSDRNFLCSCCEKNCVEIKCLYLKNFSQLCWSNLDYLQLCDGKTMLKSPTNITPSASSRWLLLEPRKNVLLLGLHRGWLLWDKFWQWILVKNKFQKYYQHIFKICCQWVELRFYPGILLIDIKYHCQDVWSAKKWIRLLGF